MRRIRRDERDRRETPDRAAAPTGRPGPGRLPLVLLPGVLLALVVVVALLAPGFGVVVTGESPPRPPDLGGPILLPAGAGAAPSALPVPTDVDGLDPLSPAQSEGRLAARGLLTPGAPLTLRVSPVPAVTYRPLPADDPVPAPPRATRLMPAPAPAPAPASGAQPSMYPPTDDAWPVPAMTAEPEAAP